MYYVHSILQKIQQEIMKHESKIEISLLPKYTK